MNITERAAKVLQEIDAELEIAEKELRRQSLPLSARTGWPTALRCLKTAIEGLLKVAVFKDEDGHNHNDASFNGRNAAAALTTLCDQWEASRK